MGRGRGKGKKQNSLIARDDSNNGEEEIIPVYKKRGRPQKQLKNETEEGEEEAEKIKEEEENGENTKSSLPNEDVKIQDAVENGRKRKKSSQVKENAEENGVGLKTTADDSVKFVGFRHIGSRRKNKPRRAAEVGVDCK